MDLNIGTAFWFASRGTGYLCSYSDEEMEHIYAANRDADRPLLRLGEEDAMKSVGLSPADGGDRFYQRSSRNKEEHKISPEPCANHQCKRVSKAGCVRVMCKRCCDRAHRTEKIQTLRDENPHCELSTPGIFINDCPAHKVSEAKILQRKEKAQRKGKSCEEGDGDEDDPRPVDDTPNNNNNDNNDCNTNSNENICENRAILSSSANPGVLSTPRTVRPYQSACKILLVGLGADEQLAGYGRHRTVFAEGGYPALCDELNVDLERLWTRNLGRDDRCISDHGKEGWFPYLDEQLVRFIQGTPIDIIADLSLPPGIGDKRILRTAASSIGLTRSCQLVKRAIQFGTLAAKQTSVEYYGSRRKGKGTSKI